MDRLFRGSMDTFLGVLIFATAGALIGVYLEHRVIGLAGVILGAVLGAFVAKLGARRFFYSVLAGTLIGGLIGWKAGGTLWVPMMAGTGSAIGGFIGINIELFVRAYRARSMEKKKPKGESS